MTPTTGWPSLADAEAAVRCRVVEGSVAPLGRRKLKVLLDEYDRRGAQLNALLIADSRSVPHAATAPSSATFAHSYLADEAGDGSAPRRRTFADGTD